MTDYCGQRLLAGLGEGKEGMRPEGCPLCEEGIAYPISYSEEIEPGGERVLGLEAYHCSLCGEEFITSAQAKRNDPKFEPIRAAGRARRGESAS